MKQMIACEKCGSRPAPEYPREWFVRINGTAKKDYLCDYCGEDIRTGDECAAESMGAEYGGSSTTNGKMNILTREHFRRSKNEHQKGEAMNLAEELREMGAAQPMEPEVEGPGEGMVPMVDFYQDRLVVAKQTLSQFQNEAEALKKTVFEIVIKDQAGSARAAELKATAQKIVKRIDTKMKEIIDEPADYIQAVRNFAANLTAPLKEARAEADRKMEIWARYVRQEREKQEKAAREAAAKLQERMNKDAKKAGIEPVELPEPKLPPTKTVIKTDSGTTYEKRKWVGKVIDPDLVERKWCSPDLKKIQEAVDEGVREMAGVDIYEEVKMVTRTK